MNAFKKISGKVDSLIQAMRTRNSKKFKTYIVEKTETVQGSPAPTDTDILNYLLPSGIDFKGQVNYAFQSKGASFSTGVDIDVFKLAGLAVGLPFLPITLQVSPSGSVSAARHRLLVVERQGDSQKPVALEDMRGITGSVAVSLGVKTGLEFAPTKDIPGLEELGLSFSVGATGSANGQFTGTYLRASDPKPSYYRKDERDSALKSDVRALLDGKDRAAGPRGKGYNPLCSMTKWTMNGTSDAGLEAAIKAKAEVKDWASASAEAGVKGPNFQGNWSWTGYRLQTQASDGTVMTQDAHLTYKKVNGQLLQMNLKGEAALEIKDLPKNPPPLAKEKEDAFGLGEKTSKVFLNALAYRAGVLYWDPQKHKLLPGSGWQIGHSVTIENLTALVDGSMVDTDKDKKRTKFVGSLAKAINVAPEAIERLLTEGKDLISAVAEDPAAQPDALFVEADFSIGSLPTEQLFKSSGKSAVTQPNAFLDKFDTAAPGLETLRLRYRMTDKQSKSTSLLKFGFTWTVDVNFELSKFEDYGSGGWIDLCVVNMKSDSLVPPAMLIT